MNDQVTAKAFSKVLACPSVGPDGESDGSAARAAGTDDPEKTAKIRILNDRFRHSYFSKGTMILTAGIQALGDEARMKLVERVSQYGAFLREDLAVDYFCEDNDPYGEHDFGTMMFEDKKVYWKIDYYDKDLNMGSDDPTDMNKTTRVMTILLASEY